ncbi:MAG: hypothetical protein ACI9TH_001350 [Kiritimatiellia bacterium]|jgi:hypothetical protein
MKYLVQTFILSFVITFAASAEDGFTSFSKLTDLDTEGAWQVEEDGSFGLHPREGEKGWTRYGSYLWLKKPYKDFILDLEFKLPPKGNSGVYFRCKDKIDPTARGIELQLLDSHGKKKLGHHDGGGVIRTAGPSKNMNKPAGEWNRVVINCKGNHLQVEMNGEKIQDLQLDQTPVKDRPMEGWIGLQDHGLPLWFRNIKIKEQ